MILNLQLRGANSLFYNKSKFYIFYFIKIVLFQAFFFFFFFYPENNLICIIL